MYFLIPEDKKKLQRIYTPYLDGCKLRKGAPQEAINAFEEFNDWFKKKVYGDIE